MCTILNSPHRCSPGDIQINNSCLFTNIVTISYENLMKVHVRTTWQPLDDSFEVLVWLDRHKCKHKYSSVRNNEWVSDTLVIYYWSQMFVHVARCHWVISWFVEQRTDDAVRRYGLSQRPQTSTEEAPLRSIRCHSHYYQSSRAVQWQIQMIV